MLKLVASSTILICKLGMPNLKGEMMTNKELWPFKPVYDELKIRLASIEDECEPLGLEVNLRNKTEEEMFIALTA